MKFHIYEIKRQNEEYCKEKLANARNVFPKSSFHITKNENYLLRRENNFSIIMAQH